MFGDGDVRASSAVAEKRRAVRNNGRARGATPAPTPKPSTPETAETKPTETPTGDAPTDAEKPAAATPTRPAPRRRNTRGSRGRTSGESAPADRRAPDAQPSNNAEPAPAAATGRLVIITLDGQIIERPMNTVRSVAVESGQLVVTTLDGKTIRRQMSNVLRMSIEP